MCFYDNVVFACGDWKWGHFKKHCQNEYRIGETCGMRLTWHTTHDNAKCTTCISLDKKARRFQKARSDFERWRGDSNRQASAAKAQQECIEIKHEIDRLTAERAARYSNVGSNRNHMRA